MNKQELVQTINNIFIEVLDDNEIVITESTASDDLSEWDSLNHIHLDSTNTILTILVTKH